MLHSEPPRHLIRQMCEVQDAEENQYDSYQGVNDAVSQKMIRTSMTAY